MVAFYDIAIASVNHGGTSIRAIFLTLGLGLLLVVGDTGLLDVCELLDGFDSGLLHSGLLDGFDSGLLDGFHSGLLHSGHRIFVGAVFCVRSNHPTI